MTENTENPFLLETVKPEWSARQPLTMFQKIFMTLLIAIFLASMWKDPWRILHLVVIISTIFYLAFSLYKLLLICFSVSKSSEIFISQQELQSLDESELPVYSILIPLYKEPESVTQIIKSISVLDYPPHLKDVQLLLEEDDIQTRQAVDALKLPQGFRVTIIPRSFPRTKPKACNVGLAKAKGKYLVIYDAEDKPEADQLKKAVVAFMKISPSVVCLQSKLNFYNQHQNLLTKWFTAEYSAWFDLSLPGLSALGAIIPLGGTSNHFITDKLKELLGWDAYNVTEDCDLGVRIYRAGYCTLMLDTTTWEEACSSLKFWIRQRTRWLKGYIQTYFVHMRNPVRLLLELGFLNFIHFQILIGGIIFAFLINPFFWFLTLIWFIFKVELLSSFFSGIIFIIGTLCLFAGNFAFVYAGAIACYHRGCFALVKYAILAPLYWVLMSIGAWRAVIQFFANPFYWEKTRHGLFPAK